MTPTLAILYPQFDPVIFSIGPIAIRWYSLAYIAGILIGWQYCRRLARRPPALLKPEAFDDFMAWAVLGIVLGGRLGYVLFYKPLHYLENPLEILQVWTGGMSFHGGLIGVAVAMGLFARRQGVAYFTLADLIAAAAPIGLLLGRIANFINGEFYGRLADPNLPWAMVFPRSDGLARHPSQLYEAGLEGLVLFCLLYLAIRAGALARMGLLSGLFLVGYGLSRIVVEFFREPDAHLGFLVAGASMGQLLSLPMVLLGLYLAVWSRRPA